MKYGEKSEKKSCITRKQNLLTLPEAIAEYKSFSQLGDDENTQK